MDDSRTIELIHRRIDDAIEPAERAELDDLLAANAEARIASDEFVALNELLAGTPAVEPPPGFVADVMAQVRDSAHAPLPFVDRRAAGARRRTLAVRLGLGIAAALAIGFILMPSLRERIDARHAGGTMIGQPDGSDSDTVIPIEGVGFGGTIHVLARADQVSLAIAFDSSAVREVRVVYDPTLLSLELPAGSGSAPSGSGDAVISTVDAPGATTELKFSRKSAQQARVGLSIRQGNELFETTINLGRSANF